MSETEVELLEVELELELELEVEPKAEPEPKAELEFCEFCRELVLLLLLLFASLSRLLAPQTCEKFVEKLLFAR